MRIRRGGKIGKGRGKGRERTVEGREESEEQNFGWIHMTIKINKSERSCMTISI